MFTVVTEDGTVVTEPRLRVAPALLTVTEGKIIGPRGIGGGARFVILRERDFEILVGGGDIGLQAIEARITVHLPPRVRAKRRRRQADSSRGRLP